MILIVDLLARVHCALCLPSMLISGLLLFYREPAIRFFESLLVVRGENQPLILCVLILVDALWLKMLSGFSRIPRRLVSKHHGHLFTLILIIDS